MVVLETLDVVLSPSSIHSQVEEFSVCIPFLDIGNPRSMLFSCPLNDGKSNNFFFGR
jgi:hypothetical protein